MWCFLIRFYIIVLEDKGEEIVCSGMIMTEGCDGYELFTLPVLWRVDGSLVLTRDTQRLCIFSGYFRASIIHYLTSISILFFLPQEEQVKAQQ